MESAKSSSTYVELALQKHEDKPEIVAAAVAALAHFYNGNLTSLACLKSVDPAVRTLAALQTTSPKKLNLDSLRINIETADREVLKLSLITIGLNKDIEHLFDPRHRNGKIVKALGQHDDKIVRQYSVWAVLENNELTLEDLGISFLDIDKEPPNVQAKLFQLAAEREKDVCRLNGIIDLGSCNDYPEAREGLAKGLLKTYYDELEEITIPWFDVEESFDNRELLSEHFARFSDGCKPYEDKALSIVEADSRFESRILVGAEGKPLYGLIKSSQLGNGTLNLFEPPTDLAAMFGIAKPLQKKRVEMKVLFLAASPVDQSPLRLGKEANDLKEQLALVKDRSVEVEVVQQWATRTNQIQMAILNEKPDIIHFSGHGDVGSLIFENELGQTVPVSAEAIAELISLFPRVKCLLLNACYSESIARTVDPHVKAVIGCDASIDDEAAIVFSRAFYRALAHGASFDEAYKFAKNDVRLNGHEVEADKYIVVLK